jgi:hypothetical protein
VPKSVRDANGQPLAYLYSRENPTEALQEDAHAQAQRIAKPVRSKNVVRGARLLRFGIVPW